MNSNEFDPKSYVACRVDDNDIEKPDPKLLSLDMVTEQSKDETISKLRTKLVNGLLTSSENRFIIMEGIVYYISDVNDNPVIRLYVPNHLQLRVIKQYHDMNGHMGIDKTYDTIKRRYYFPNMYKILYKYIHSCVVCQNRIMKANKAPLQEMDIPPYPFAKISLDLSGPYPKSLSGNKYIIAFVDHYSGWPEAFPVPDKTADNVAHLLIEEIFPRYGSPLQIVTDNGTENVNKTMKEVLAALNIHHVTTSFYHPEANAKVERFHRTLHDILAKKLENDVTSWDLYLNQALAAIRFSISESTQFSPYFLVYNRDVVFPIDSLLRPRQKYTGEQQHQIALEQQHKSFMLVHKRLRKAKQRQTRYANRNRKLVEFKIGDPVYYKVHQRNSKLQNKWTPYYRIIEQKSPVTVVIRSQLDGSTIKTHVNHLQLADIDTWTIPKPDRALRKTRYVVAPDDSPQNSESDNDSVSEITDPPLARISPKL